MRKRKRILRYETYAKRRVNICSLDQYGLGLKRMVRFLTMLNQSCQHERFLWPSWFGRQVLGSCSLALWCPGITLIASAKRKEDALRVMFCLQVCICEAEAAQKWPQKSVWWFLKCFGRAEIKISQSWAKFDAEVDFVVRWAVAAPKPHQIDQKLISKTKIIEFFLIVFSTF